MAFIRSNIKNILILTVVLIGAFYLYSYFFGSDSGVGSLAVTASDQIDNAVGKDLLLLLADLKTLRLDESIFNDPTFKSLRNFRVELSPEPIGRDNPFAPYSGSGGTGSGVQIRSFETR